MPIASKCRGKASSARVFTANAINHKQENKCHT